jgi:hypothetical protein
LAILRYALFMFGLSRTTRRRTAKGLLALMSGLWLLAAAAPCVMAAPPCLGTGGAPCQSADSAAMPDCDALEAVDCRRADANLTDRVALPDLSALPPRLLTVASVAVQPVSNPPPADAERFVLRLASPPLYLRHAALLI